MRLPLAIAIIVAISSSESLAGECPPRPAQNGLDYSLPCYLHSPIPESDSKVYFGTDSSELSAEAKTTLDRQAAILRQFPALKIELSGFADTREAPSSTEKAELGLKRADAVRAHLIGNGIGTDRITAVGHPYATIIPRRVDAETLAAMRHVRTDASDR